MLERLAGGTDPGRVASCYADVADVLVFDEADASFAGAVGDQGIRSVVTSTLMRDLTAATALAEAVLGSV
jgi:hypothetical protein